MNKQKKLIIIPTYNEKENITRLISEIFKQKVNTDILVVDDGSPDGTGEAVEKMAEKDNRIKVIHRKGKLGLGSAYVEGFKYAIKQKYDLIFQMDADFSHQPKYLKTLIKASEKYDLVLGSRWTKGGGVKGWAWYRYLSSWGANLIARTLLSLRPRDITTGFRCYRRKVLEKINLEGIVSAGYAFLEELIYRTQKAGFTIGEIPIIFIDRTIGQSKMTIKEISTSAKAIVKLFFRRKGVKIFFLFLVVIIALMLRFLYLGKRPFDGDEGLIGLTTSANLQYLIEKAQTDVQPILFHLLTYISVKIFGISEFSLRLIPALFGAGLIIISYLLAKKLFNYRTGIVCALLVAISPYLIYFSQEARMYSCLAFFATLSTYLLIIALEKQKWQNYLFYILAISFAIYTQYLGLILLFAHGLAIVLFYRKFIIQYIYCATFSIILFLPNIKFFLHQLFGRLNDYNNSLNIIENIQGIVGAFYRFGTGRLFLDITGSGLGKITHDFTMLAIFVLSLIIPLYLFLSGILKEKYNKIILTIIVVFVATGVFYNQIGSEAARSLIIIAPYFYIYIAHTITSKWNKTIIKFSALILILLMITSLYKHYKIEIFAPGINRVSDEISQKASKNDILYLKGSFGGGETWALDYYLTDTIEIIDYYQKYEVGNMKEIIKIDVYQDIEKYLNNNSVWFIDNTYATDTIKNNNLQATKNYLGIDKEEKELILWKINKK